MTKVTKAVFNASTATVFADNTNEDISEGDFRNKFGDVSDSAAFLEEVNTFSKQQRFKKGADVASATVLPLVSDGNSFDVTGTVTVTSFADLGGTGTEINLHFDGILTLTHHATNLILPTGANIITATGDHATFINYASGDYRCINYQRASGAALSSSTVVIDDSALIVVPQTNLQDFADGVDHALLKARGTGVNTTYVSSVSVGGTTFAQPEVFGEIKSDEGYFDVHYTGATGITVATLSATSTYVYIDNAGSLQQQTTIPTRQDWSRKIFTMRIGVNTSTNVIIGFEYLNNPLGNYTNSLRDVYSYLLAQGVPFKKEMDITGRVADLGFDVASGSFLEFGGTGDIDNPNIKAFDQADNVSYNLMSRTALVSSETNLLKFWDNATTITVLGSTTCVGHRLYRFSSGNFALQYGQGNYANMSLAKTGAKLEEYVLNPALKDAVFLGWWLLEETATATSGTVDAEFVEYTIGIQGGSSSGLSGALLKGNNLSDVLDAQSSINNVTAVSSATAEHVLTKDTSTGNAVWKAASGGLSNVVEDTSPQLGGGLDADGNNIYGIQQIRVDRGNGSILIEDNNSTGTSDSYLLFQDQTNANFGSLRMNGSDDFSIANEHNGGSLIFKTNGGTISTRLEVNGDGDFDFQGNDHIGLGTISLKEQANANAYVAGSGQLWVKTATPNQLWFTDDAGTDIQLTGSGAAAGDVVAASTVYETLWIDAAAMVPRSTNGSQAGSRELATNDVMVDYMAFDTTTSEGCQFKLSLPDQLVDNAPIRFRFYWTAESGSGTVIWNVGAFKLSDSGALDAAFPTPDAATADTLLTANDVHISDGAAVMTLTGIADNDIIMVEIERDVADTLGVDAQLLGVKIQYPVNNTATTVWS
jgi:hypothetical protein